MNFEVKDYGGLQKYIKATGTGTNADPFIPENTIKFSDLDITKNVAGALRIAQMNRLFSGKTLNQDDAYAWDVKGTGTGSWANNKYSMSVTSGQYLVRQSRRPMPYFEGAPMVAELTCENFQIQSNVTKTLGLYSSTTTAPYDSTFDGIRIHNDGTTLRIITDRAGTETNNVAYASWDNYTYLNSIGWHNNLTGFQVFLIEKIWLGGLAYRVWVATSAGFAVAHTLRNIGATGYIENTPNQFVRYVIRSSTGSGSFTANCSTVYAEGSIREGGKPVICEVTTAIACNSASTVYALMGIKKRTDRKDNCVVFEALDVINTANNDYGHLMLLINPTLSASLTYANVTDTAIQLAVATNQTVSSLGYSVTAFGSAQAGNEQGIANNFYAWLSQQIDNTMDEFVIAYRPTTATQSVTAIAQLKQF